MGYHGNISEYKHVPYIIHVFQIVVWIILIIVITSKDISEFGCNDLPVSAPTVQLLRHSSYNTAPTAQPYSAAPEAEPTGYCYYGVTTDLSDTYRTLTSLIEVSTYDYG